jgi:hypothetical protein
VLWDSLEMTTKNSIAKGNSDFPSTRESVVLRPDEKIRFLVIILLQLLGNGKTFSILVPPV